MAPVAVPVMAPTTTVAPPAWMNNPLPDSEVSPALNSADAELRYILNSSFIPPFVQAKVYQLGYVNVALFSKIDQGDGVRGARTFALEDLEIQAAGSPPCPGNGGQAYDGVGVRK